MRKTIELLLSVGLFLGMSHNAFAQFGEVILGAALVGGGVFACSKTTPSDEPPSRPIVVNSTSAIQNPVTPTLII